MRFLLIIIAFICSTISLIGQSQFLGIKQNTLRNSNQETDNYIIKERQLDLDFMWGYSFKKVLLVSRIGFAIDHYQSNRTIIFPQSPNLIASNQILNKRNSFHIGIGLEKPYIFKEKIYLSVGFYIPFEFSPSYEDYEEISYTNLELPYGSASYKIIYPYAFSAKGLLSGRFHYFIFPQWSIGVEFNAGVSFEKPQPDLVSIQSVYDEMNELIQEEIQERVDKEFTINKISTYGIGVQFHFK